MWELWGVEISAFPLAWDIAYTTAFCYRTSRDIVILCNICVLYCQLVVLG